VQRPLTSGPRGWPVGQVLCRFGLQLRAHVSTIRYFQRLMSPLIPFIQVGIRCTKTSRQPIGSMELRETLLSMLPFATPIRKSRLSINDLLDGCNPCEYPSGSGKRLLRITSWNCLGLSLNMISFGQLWTN
jgi:hypothetical protein